MEKYVLIDGTLYHHGIQGQKWGHRRWQNEDGSLTPEGREHYGYGDARDKVKSARSNLRALKERRTGRDYKYGELSRFTKTGRQLNKDIKSAKADYKQAKKEYKQTDEYKAHQEKIKKAAIAGTAIVGTALVAYGAYKLGKLKLEKANTIIEGRKLCAKNLADSNRSLYSQLSGYYQGKGYYSDPKNYPVNKPSDIYSKGLRKDMARYQKNITEATKYYNEASKASKSSNFDKLKTAYKYAKEAKDYNSLLENASDYIERDKDTRRMWNSNLNFDKYYRRKNK